MAASRLDLSFLRASGARRHVALAAVAGAVLGLAFGAFAPRRYQSWITVMPVTPQRPSGIASLLSGDLGNIASTLGMPGGAGTDAARIAAVLQSTAVTDAVIDRFDLQKRYGTRYREGAREKLWKRCEVKAIPKTGLVQLACRDGDPRFLQELLGFFAEHGNQVFRRVNVSSASEEVRFLERRVEELRARADEAAARVRQFQEEHHIVDLDTQARSLVSSIVALDAQRMARRMELDYANTFSSRDEAGSRKLESQIAILDDALRDLEVEGVPAAAAGPRKDAGKRPGLFPAALSVPRLRAQYEGLYRDRKVAEATLVFALDRLEGAKASEARDVSTFVILDPPTLATRPVSPPLGVVPSGVAGLLLGLAGAVAFEWWRSRRGKAA